MRSVEHVVLSVAAGLALGVGDLWAKAELAPPWPELANHTLTWAAAPLVLALVLRLDPVQGALYGVVLMTVAVESYYVFADSFGFAFYSDPLGPHALEWLRLGVVTGLVLGAAGGVPVLLRRSLRSGPERPN